MFWLKKRFHAADFAPSQDMLGKLMMAMPAQYEEFLMISTETDEPLTSDYYIGLPNEKLASAFAGFEPVNESDLPKEIDTFLLGDQTKLPFTQRFKFRGRK